MKLILVQVRDAARFHLCFTADGSDLLVSFPLDSLAELAMLVPELRFEAVYPGVGVSSRAFDDLPGLLLGLVQHRLEACLGLEKSTELSGYLGAGWILVGFFAPCHEYYPRPKISEHR